LSLNYFLHFKSWKILALISSTSEMTPTWYSFLINNLFRTLTHWATTAPNAKLIVEAWFSFAINYRCNWQLGVIERNHHWDNRSKILLMLYRIFVWFMTSLLFYFTTFNWTTTWRITFRKSFDLIISALFRFVYRYFWWRNSNEPLGLLGWCINLFFLLISNKCLIVILLLVPHWWMNFIFEFIQILRITFLIDWYIVIVSSILLREWMIFMRDSFWGSDIMLRGTWRFLLFQSKWNEPFLIL
jgi:hypothetical protein